MQCGAKNTRRLFLLLCFLILSATKKRKGEQQSQSFHPAKTTGRSIQNIWGWSGQGSFCLLGPNPVKYSPAGSAQLWFGLPGSEKKRCSFYSQLKAERKKREKQGFSYQIQISQRQWIGILVSLRDVLFKWCSNTLE